MKTIYYVPSDKLEADGMFDADGNLLGAWCINDAMWRGEYMNGFMKALGIEVVTSHDPELLKKLDAHFDY